MGQIAKDQGLKLEVKKTINIKMILK